jgi:hypothetical protein
MDIEIDVAVDSDGEVENEEFMLGTQPAVGSKIGEWFVERSKFIPLRLTIPERKYLRLLDAALTVSEYTDKIDTLGFSTTKAKRIVYQIRELCAIMSGLVLSADYKKGQELFTDRDFEENADFYQRVGQFRQAIDHRIDRVHSRSSSLVGGIK